MSTEIRIRSILFSSKSNNSNVRKGHAPPIIDLQVIKNAYDGKRYLLMQVNIPKTKKTYCKNKECKNTQGKRHYDRKQSRYGGHTKHVFHKKINRSLAQQGQQGPDGEGAHQDGVNIVGTVLVPDLYPNSGSKCTPFTSPLEYLFPVFVE
ncbi:unnamed protein product [Triticum turgidum subsp. durum]|uniref:Uncharacterized protein n=1 Tax=Triticum turgidum subsp. durum TaxID=4567 RepID=A0A9R1QRX9_TRITD|nr:unnamed protein product [Triticum turgidum subsp. durum]